MSEKPPIKINTIPPLSRRVVAAADIAATDGNFYQPEAPVVRQKQDIADRRGESTRIVKRLLAIMGDHSESAQRLDIKFQAADMKAVIDALRCHARGEEVVAVSGERDEIRQHVLNSLFSELVEEPSNIFFTTTTGPDTIRYDAMEPDFWIECLDLLEQKVCGK